jgi:hypothetical protein
LGGLSLSHGRYEITADGKQVTKLDQILLNGNNIALLVPGGDPESASAASDKAAAANDDGA